MNVRVVRRLFRVLAGMSVVWGLAGCGDDSADRPIDSGVLDSGGVGLGGVEPDPSLGGERAAILASVLRMIESASTNPGGSHFTMAAESLNDFFGEGLASDYAAPEGLRAFLAEQKVPTGDMLKVLEGTRFDGMADGRHLEDTLLLRDATRTALKGMGAETNDLARAQRLFDWIVRHVQLAPVGQFTAPGIRAEKNQPFQAQARPYDVLLRGIATEDGGLEWAERSWLFLAMCRQAGLTAGLILVDPAPVAAATDEARQPARLLGCGVLHDGEVYLFNAALGRAIAGRGGRGVATLEEAATDPEILRALDLPGFSFPVSHDDLARGRLMVLLETTLGTMTQRMRLLQQQLAGEQRMVVYSDPSEAAAAFRSALGARLSGVWLWQLPLDVGIRLFQDSVFNKASGYGVQYFDARWPLLKARLAQLKGDLNGAIEAYVLFRFADGLTPSR